MVGAIFFPSSAFQAHMEVVMMPPPRPDFIEPTTITGRVFTHLNLGARKDENPCGARVRSSGF